MSHARAGARRVTTSLSKGLWWLAQEHGVSWAEALRVGIVALLEGRGVAVPDELREAPVGSTSPTPPAITAATCEALRRAGWTPESLRACPLEDEALADELARTVPGVGATLARRIVTETRRGGAPPSPPEKKRRPTSRRP